MEQLEEEKREATETTGVDVREVQAKDLPNDVERAVLASEDSGSIGKFRDTGALLNAYNNLQAEFTRKCQRLAEFENNAKSQAGSITFADTQEVLEFVKSNSELQNRLVTDFLTANIQPAPTLIASNVGGGIPFSAPPKPTTLAEAKEMAQKLLR